MAQERSGFDHEGDITAAMELFDAGEMADLHRAIMALLSELDSQEVTRKLVDGAIRILKGDFGYLLMRDADGPHSLRLVASRGLDLPAAVDENAEKVLADNVSALVMTGEKREASLAGASPAPMSLAYSPLVTPEGGVGVLCVGSFRTLLTFKSVRALTLLAKPAALVLESVRLYEGSISMEKQLRIVADVQRVLTGASFDVAYPRFCQAVLEVVPFDLALFVSHEPKTRDYSISNIWSPIDGHIGRRWIGRRLSGDRSLHARAIGQPSTIVEDLGRTGAGLERAWLSGVGMVSGVLLPLVSRETTIGVFSVWSRAPKAFKSMSRDFILSLGHQLTLAIRNQRLFGQLERAKQEWESTFDAMNEAVWITDETQRVRRFNRTFKRAIGLRNDEIIGASAPSLIGADPYELSFGLGDEIRSGHLRRELSGTKLGQAIEVTATKIMHDDGGRIVYVARDVTEAREMNVRLQQASRLAGLGQLAAAMAHEINNPLAYIAANLHRIQDRAGGLGAVGGGASPAVKEDFFDELPVLASESLEGVSRVKRIVEKLQIYAKGESGESTFSLNDLVDFCLTLVWATLHQRAQLVTDFGELPQFRGDQHRLSQVFVNILVSAARSVSPKTVERNVLTVKTGHDEKSWRITFAISRDGEAVPLDPMGIFLPAEGTEEDAFGTGLGLEPDFDIVRELGGAIEKRGAPIPHELVLVLPQRAATTGRLSSTSITLPGVRAFNGHVLIIDDEPYVRRALRRVLSAAHAVELARDGAQALHLIESSPTGFDVILCDVVMPGMSGLDFAAILEERWPHLRARLMFMTGGVFGAEAEAKLRAGPNPVLRKPIQPRDLLVAVGRILAGGPGE